MVSVIMLTYNREKMISRAVESILNQTYKEFEYIIVDNGSTDQSGVIADQYAKQDKRVKVLHINRSNIGIGRNTGLDACTGEYVTFIDDDDWVEPDMLEFLHQLALQYDADISLCGSVKEIDGKIMPNCTFDEKLIMSPDEAVINLLKRKKYNAAMPSKMLKRTLFDKIRFSVEGKYDDITVVYKYFAEAKKVVGYGLPKYCFYRHSGNNSAFTTNDYLITPQQLDEYLKAFRERTIYLSEKLPQISEYAQYSEWSYMISMCNKINTANLLECHRQLERMKKELQKKYNKFYNSPYITEQEKIYMKKYIE